MPCSVRPIVLPPVGLSSVPSGRSRSASDSAPPHWPAPRMTRRACPASPATPRRCVGDLLPVALLGRSRALAADARADLASPCRDVERDFPDRVTAGDRTGGGQPIDRRSASASFTEGPCQAPPRVQPAQHVEQTFSFGHGRDCARLVIRAANIPRTSGSSPAGMTSPRVRGPTEPRRDGRPIFSGAGSWR